jgi:hypothetical protein
MYLKIESDIIEEALSKELDELYDKWGELTL